MLIGGLNNGSWLTRGDLARRRIRIPSVAKRLVLRFYHPVGGLIGNDECLDLAQRLNAWDGGWHEVNQANYARLEHPLRNRQEPTTYARISRALIDGYSSSCRRSPNPRLLTVPRVPRISNLSTIDVMGVKLPSCTTGADRTVDCLGGHPRIV